MLGEEGVYVFIFMVRRDLWKKEVESLWTEKQAGRSRHSFCTVTAVGMPWALTHSPYYLICSRIAVLTLIRLPHRILMGYSDPGLESASQKNL